MSVLDIEQFRGIMHDCAGAPAVELSAPTELAQLGFTQLGYDSLAVIEMAAEVRRRHGVEIPDDVVFTLNRPQDVLDYVNGLAAAA